MIKECRVIRNNEAYTLVSFDDIEIQFPPIKKDKEKVFVSYENGRYIIVDEDNLDDITNKSKRKNYKKKTVSQKESDEDLVESLNDE